MKAFLDTSVLVAVFYAEHERHTPSIELLRRFAKADASCAAHNLAEVYSVVTGRSGKDRVTGDEALLFLGNIRERLTIVALNVEEYTKALAQAASVGITGGAIYDAIIGNCALKAKADALYTWNTKDFQRLGPEIASRVRTP